MCCKKKMYIQRTPPHLEKTRRLRTSRVVVLLPVLVDARTHTQNFFWGCTSKHQLETRFARLKKITNRVTLNQPYGVKVRRQNALPTGGTHMHRGLCQTTKSAFIHHGFPEIRNKRTESYYKRRAHYGHFHTLTRMPNVCSMAIRLWDW